MGTPVVRHSLRRAVVPVLLLCCAACQPAAPEAAPPVASATSSAPTSTLRPPPPPPKPARTAACPYLSTDTAAEVNGQHVGSVRISAGDPPSCFFYRPDGGLQLRTRIYHGPLDTARALVDAAAPVRTSSKAELPGGWSGGAQPTADGAVYAVARPSGEPGEGTAIVVHTNQAQSVKGREIAKQVIAAFAH